MADGLLVAVLVEVRREHGGIDAEVARRESRPDRRGVAFNGGRSSTRLQVETIMHSGTPGMAARARVASASSSRAMAMRSRSAMGAVLWFTPMSASVIGDRTCARG